MWDGGKAYLGEEFDGRVKVARGKGRVAGVLEFLRTAHVLSHRKVESDRERDRDTQMWVVKAVKG